MKTKGNKGKGVLFPKMAKFMKREKKHRFNLPYSLECKGCHSIMAKGVEVNVIKLKGKHHREFWKYILECLFCRHKIVMRVTAEGLDVIEGAEDKRKNIGLFGIDWNEWRKKRSKEILDNIDPSLSKMYNIFDVFPIALIVGDRSGNGPRHVV